MNKKNSSMESHKCIVCMSEKSYSNREVRYLSCLRCLEFTCNDCRHDCVIRTNGLFSFRENGGKSYSMEDLIVENL